MTATLTMSPEEARSMLRFGTRRNNLLRFTLAAIALLIMAATTSGHILNYPFGVDLEIPLRAAERWLNGDAPYQASAFTAPAGPTQPFVYPPYVLPVVALLVNLPWTMLKVVWFGILLACAIFACRRLAIPRRWVPFVLIWPPFSEGLIGGNVQILLFAVFTSLFWVGGESPPFRPTERDLTDRRESSWKVGLQVAVIGALKVSQYQPGLFVLRHRWRAAAITALIGVALVAASLPITGVSLWVDWMQQMGRATDAHWALGGIQLSRLVPGFGTAVVLLLVPATFLIPRTAGGVWVGLVSVVGATSLHPFGLLFLLPAMLAIRWELSFVAAGLMATNTWPGAWAGILIVTVALLVATRRGELREPGWAAESPPGASSVTTAPVSRRGSNQPALGE